MLSLEIYKILHLAGLMMLFLGFGGVLAFGASNHPSKSRIVAIFHGAGLALLLLGGFGMLAKLQVGFPGWMLVKLVIWLLLGGLLVVGKRNFVTPKTLWTIALVLGIIAAYLGIFKPF